MRKFLGWMVCGVLAGCGSEMAPVAGDRLPGFPDLAAGDRGGIGADLPGEIPGGVLPGKGEDPTGPAAPCGFAPETFRFGIVAPGRTATLEFRIGSPFTDCEVRDFGVADFVDVDVPSDFEVPAGTDYRVPMTFTAETPMPSGPTVAAWGYFNGTWRELTFVAPEQEPCLLVVPESVDFGAVGLGCTSPLRATTVINVCDRDLEIAGVTVEGSGVALAHPALPMRLARGQQAEVAATWVPAAEGPFTGAILFDLADGTSARAELFGTATGDACN